jgi:flagellar biosynthesis/type III secretory pathway M-ring protein FliF/YscJ
VETARKQPKERLRQVAGYLGRLGTVEKLLVGCVVVIVGMTFFLVSQYAGGGSAVPAGLVVDVGERARAVSLLQGQGIEAEANATGEILVRSDHALRAQALLMEERIGPTSTASFIENLIAARSWMNSRQDNHQQYWALYSQHLSELLSHWSSLRQARVNINMPEQAGLGRAHRAPSASVMVWPVSGELPQDTVDAIAEGVAGSVAGLEASAVSIVDGVSGMAYHAQDDRRVSARRALEHKFQVEGMLEEKIRGFLRDIPGMSLSVLARVDNTRRSQQSQTYDKPVSGIASESRTETVQQNTVRGGTPGTRSNESMSISQGSADGSMYTETTEDSTFDTRFGSTTENVEDPGGGLQGVSVMLGVPRSYVQRLLELEAAPPAEGEDPASPTAADIAQRFDLVRSDLERRIQLALGNVVTGDPADVAVTVSMLSDVTLVGGAGAGVGGFGGVGGASGTGVGFMGLAGGGLIDKAVLGVLALVSLAMMALLVRKATKKVELPTAEELVGIPPALQADGDLYGEADVGDVPMSGIELDEDQVRAGKMLDQVGELVTSSPETAATLLHAWISSRDD